MKGDADGPVHREANCFSPADEAVGRDPATFSPAELAHFGLPMPAQFGSVREWATVVHNMKHHYCESVYHYHNGQPVVAGANAVGSAYVGPVIQNKWTGWGTDVQSNDMPCGIGQFCEPCIQYNYCGTVTEGTGYVHVPTNLHPGDNHEADIWAGVGGGNGTKNCDFLHPLSGPGLIQAGVAITGSLDVGLAFLFHENTGSVWPSCTQQKFTKNGLVFAPLAGNLLDVIAWQSGTSISDQTTGDYFTSADSPGPYQNSAECIAEYPNGSLSGQSDFGMILWEFCRAIVAGTLYGIGSIPGIWPVNYYNSSGCNTVYDFTTEGPPTYPNSSFNIQYNEGIPSCIYW